MICRRDYIRNAGRQELRKRMKKLGGLLCSKASPDPSQCKNALNRGNEGEERRSRGKVRVLDYNRQPLVLDRPDSPNTKMP